MKLERELRFGANYFLKVCQYVGVAANCVTIAVGLQQIVMTFGK